MQDHKRLSHYRQSSLKLRTVEGPKTYRLILGIELVITITLIVSDPENEPKTKLSFVQIWKAELRAIDGMHIWYRRKVSNEEFQISSWAPEGEQES